MAGSTAIENTPVIEKQSKGLDLDQIQITNRRRILVVDDEAENVTLLKRIFMNEGFNVSGARSGAEALDKLVEISPTLVLLDMLMPDMNGAETFERIRKVMNVPVVIVSAVDQKDEIIRLLHMGADDYVTKPFNEAELIARVNAVLRRSERAGMISALSFPSLNLTIDFETYEVVYHNARIQLTGKMFEVLALLARNAPRVVNYHEITHKVWGENTPSVRNRLKYLIYLLRQEFLKIKPGNDVIENIDRLGYRLCSDK